MVVYSIAPPFPNPLHAGDGGALLADGDVHAAHLLLLGSPVSQAWRWLRMVSTHTAVLPVLRSPMISCR